MKNVQAPSDAACAVAWQQIMTIARRHALVLAAYGGVATLAMPEDQRTEGIRARVLQTHRMQETPPTS